MTANNALKLQQCSDQLSHCGYWKLPPGRAITLNPGQAGVLRVAQGQVWATRDGPHHGPANDWGDLVLHRGEQLALMPGQHVVVEPFGDACTEPAYLSWEPATGPGSPVPTDQSGWRDVLAHPNMPMDDDMIVTVRVLGRMFSKLRAWLGYFVAGHRRVLLPLESNQP